MGRLAVLDFEASHLEAAGCLLAERHAAHREVEPQLSAEWEDPQAARREVAALLEQPDATGAVAFSGGEPVGFMLGVPRPGAAWGANAWVGPAGYAARDPEVIADLYAHAAERWVAVGRKQHYALVPATDRGDVAAWFRLCFGQQHTHAIRELPAPVPVALPSGVRLRRVERADLETLAAMDELLPAHLRRSPCFATVESTPLEEAISEWVEVFEDQRVAAFVAEREGVILGTSLGCPVTLSTAHASLARPEEAGMLSYVAVVPEARGGGLGPALAGEVLAWASASGYQRIVTDWRTANLQAARSWPRLGFRPSFLRLYRSI